MFIRVRFLKTVIITSVCSIYGGLLLFAMLNYCSRCRTTIPLPYGLEEDARSRKGTVCLVERSTLDIVEIDLINRKPQSFKETEEENSDLLEGGAWKPTGCQSLQKVAIIIPYRNREEHLKILLSRLHPMLKKQQIEYRIFVVEQYGNDLYNKGKLNNIAFSRLKTFDNFDCVIFHDVDLIPEHDGNLYLCDEQVRHLSPAVDEMRYHVMYYNLIGGVVAIKPKNFVRANGYANIYWGWGNEDDDFAVRTGEIGLLITRPPDGIGRYKMVPHLKSNRASQGNSLFFSSRYRWRTDGLNNRITMNHSIVSLKYHKLYTHILVNVGPVRKRPQIAQEDNESLWWFLQFYYP